MDAVTYPDKKVIQFIRDSFIPLQIPHNAKPESTDFNIKWTPTLITLGPDNREHHRTVGFLDPDDFRLNSEWETYTSAHALAWGDDAWPTFSRVKTSGYSLARRIY